MMQNQILSIWIPQFPDARITLAQYIFECLRKNEIYRDKFYESHWNKIRFNILFSFSHTGRVEIHFSKEPYDFFTKVRSQNADCFTNNIGVLTLQDDTEQVSMTPGEVSLSVLATNIAFSHV